MYANAEHLKAASQKWRQEHHRGEPPTPK